jgi:hypothetical protein
MDTVGTFEPSTILLWRKVEQHPEAARIIRMFPKRVYRS